MKILVVAATREEVSSLISNFKCSISDLKANKVRSDFGGRGSELGTRNSELGARTSELSGHNKSEIEHPKFEILITGVGMTATAFALGRHLASNQYDLAVNLGIAGSFDRNIPLGTVVEVVQDTFTELGAEDDTRFITLEALGFGRTIFKTDARVADYYTKQGIWQVTAATVNTVHGEDASIAKLHQRISPQLESMEGAAFFYACEQMGLRALQIRAVSNYVEKRNRDAWEIGLAIKNLNTFAVEILSVIG